MPDAPDLFDTYGEAILDLTWGWDNIRLDVFQLLAWGYQDAESEIRNKHLEEDITGLISEAMDKKLSYGTMLPAHFIYYNMKNENPVKTPGKFGTSRKKVDVIVEHTGNRPYRHYIFEAKRCHRSYQKGIEWYAKGITSFIKRDYARDAPEASVLGLVQSDTPDEWREKLKTYAAAEPALKCESLPADVTVTPDLATMAVSTHRRDDDSLIDLYHVFLDCKKP